MSVGGLFIETSVTKKVDSTLKLDFRVEGQISAHAIVRRTEPSGGLALKFTEMRNEDNCAWLHW